MMLSNYRLQFITHHNTSYSYIDSAHIALKGGCRWIQLRMKEASEELLEETALIVQRMCRRYGATFIIDDNALLVKRIGADGVHLGKSDMPIAEARKILGNDFIIGSTVNTFEDIVRILEQGTPNYFGCGPLRFTLTKQRLAPTLGYGGYKEITAKMRERGIEIPLFAIGGIVKSDITKLLACGVDGIAISGSIINAENPTNEMAEIAEIINKQK